MRKRYLLLVTAALLAFSAIAAAWPHNPPPDNFGFQLVYMADGVFDTNTPPPTGEYDNLADWFHKGVMGRTEAEIEAERAKAQEYFHEQFGLDADLANIEAFALDPRTDYRAYKITGYDVPSEGWVVRDGGFRLMIPAGTVLHGEFGGPGGWTMPRGGMVVFGEYNIDVTRPGDGAQPDDIIIHYESGSPIIGESGLPTAFQCIISSESFEDHGGGLAQGVSASMTLDDGTQLSNIRNVLTFPGIGFEGEALLQQ